MFLPTGSQNWGLQIWGLHLDPSLFISSWLQMEKNSRLQTGSSANQWVTSGLAASTLYIHCMEWTQQTVYDSYLVTSVHHSHCYWLLVHNLFWWVNIFYKAAKDTSKIIMLLHFHKYITRFSTVVNKGLDKERFFLRVKVHYNTSLQVK